MNVIKNCLVCGKELYRSTVKGTLKRRVGKHQVTCGGNCSKIYIRISTYIRSYWRNKKKND